MILDAPSNSPCFVLLMKSHPQLFSIVTDFIVSQGNLSGFNPQDVFNILWAYTTAGKSHTWIFQKLANVAITR